MSSLYLLNKKYWYISSRGKSYATKYTTPFSETDVREQISNLPESDKRRLALFDNIEKAAPMTKVTMSYAIEQYCLSSNGLDNETKYILDWEKHHNYENFYRYTFGRLNKYWCKYDIKDVDGAKITNWVKSMRVKLKPQSALRMLYALSAVLTFSVGRGWIAKNPISDKFGEVKNHIRASKAVYKYKGRKVKIDDQDLNRLLSVIDNKQIYFIVLIASLLGTRKREILTLKVSDIDNEGYYFHIRECNAKTRNERDVYFGFSEELKELFKNAVVGRQADDKILPLGTTHVRYLCKVYWAKAGVAGKWTLRDLRHHACSLMMKVANINSVAQQMGTSVALITKVYDNTKEQVASQLDALKIKPEQSVAS